MYTYVNWYCMSTYIYIYNIQTICARPNHLHVGWSVSKWAQCNPLNVALTELWGSDPPEDCLGWWLVLGLPYVWTFYCQLLTNLYLNHSSPFILTLRMRRFASSKSASLASTSWVNAAAIVHLVASAICSMRVPRCDARSRSNGTASKPWSSAPSNWRWDELCWGLDVTG